MSRTASITGDLSRRPVAHLRRLWAAHDSIRDRLNAEHDKPEADRCRWLIVFLGQKLREIARELETAPD